MRGIISKSAIYAIAARDVPRVLRPGTVDVDLRDYNRRVFPDLEFSLIKTSVSKQADVFICPINSQMIITNGGWFVGEFNVLS